MSLPPLPTSAANKPSTSHNGLLPSAAMALPQLTQGPMPMGQPLLRQPIGQPPAPPQQWQGAEESMRNWLYAKAEEDKRKREEEKTRQELLRLEQRRIEQDMLRMALTGGIPPHLIPMLFAAMGNGNLPNASLEWAQHHMVQGHHLQQQQLQQYQQLLPDQTQASPKQQRSVSGLPSQRYGSQKHPVPVAPPLTTRGPPATPQSSGSQSSYQMSPVHQPQGSVTRSPPTSHLPKPDAVEMRIHSPLPGNSSMQILPGQPGHPLHRPQTAQQAQQESLSSPSISFHHWQPPTTPQAGMSSASQRTNPSDHTSSPKKHNTEGSQQAALHPPRNPETYPHASPSPDPLSRT